MAEVALALRVRRQQEMAQGWRGRETIQGWVYRLFTIVHGRVIMATLNQQNTRTRSSRIQGYHILFQHRPN